MNKKVTTKTFEVLKRGPREKRRVTTSFVNIDRRPKKEKEKKKKDRGQNIISDIKASCNVHSFLFHGRGDRWKNSLIKTEVGSNRVERFIGKNCP